MNSERGSKRSVNVSLAGTKVPSQRESKWWGGGGGGGGGGQNGPRIDKSVYEKRSKVKERGRQAKSAAKSVWTCMEVCAAK